MKEKYARAGLQVIGIHTPEFEFEKERSRVEAAAAKFKLDHPIFMDNDYGYWNALENHYWPAFYLADRSGIIRARAVGEIHEGTEKGNRMEEIIRSLLKEENPA